MAANAVASATNNYDAMITSRLLGNADYGNGVSDTLTNYRIP